jgi:hypothetical protein
MERPAALPNSPTLTKLLEMLVAKLNEEMSPQLPSKQRAVGSNPAWDCSSRLNKKPRILSVWLFVPTAEFDQKSTP